MWKQNTVDELAMDGGQTDTDAAAAAAVQALVTLIGDVRSNNVRFVLVQRALLSTLHAA